MDDDFVIFQGEMARVPLPQKFRSAVKKSIYKGVSANGLKWQVSLTRSDSLQTMVMGKNQKYFSPSLKCEILAARAYDRFVIQTLGLKAKTNFSYTRKELILMIKDIQDDLRFNAEHEPTGEFQRFSFKQYKIA